MPDNIITVLAGLVLLFFISRPILGKWRARSQKSSALTPALTSFEKLEEELRSLDMSSAPYSTTLFPSDAHLLLVDGYVPLQVVIGNVAYSMGLRGVTSSVARAFKQGEMPMLTAMLNDARKLALHRLLQNAAKLEADGVIGVVFTVNDVLDFTEVTAMGTAVKKVGEVPAPKSPSLNLAVQ